MKSGAAKGSARSRISGLNTFRVVTVGAPDELFVAERVADMERLREISSNEHGIFRNFVGDFSVPHDQKEVGLGVQGH